MNWSVKLPLIINAIAIIAVAGCSGQRGNQVEHRHVAFDISPDGQQVVFSSAGGDLYLFQLKTSQVKRIDSLTRKLTSPAFSSDGSSIVFSAEATGKKGSCIFEHTIKDRGEHQLTSDNDVCDCVPFYSRDGSQIVFARAHRLRPYSMGGTTWDNWDLYVMKSDGTGSRRVTTGNYRGINSPKFLPDGKTIVFSANGGPTGLDSSIFEIDANGAEPPRTLAKDRPANFRGGAWASEPNVSTDGNSVAFISDRTTPFAYDVVVMNRDGANPRSLGVTKTANYNQSPKSLPDGKSILYLAGTEKNAGSRPIFSLWQVDIDGKNSRRVADSGLFTDPENWKNNQ